MKYIILLLLLTACSAVPDLGEDVANRSVNLIIIPEAEVNDSVEMEINDSFQICVSNHNPVFTHAFTDVSKIDKISPSGFWMTEEFFKGHSFIWTEGANVPIYAPVDMTLTSGAFYNMGGVDDYVLFFDVSCEIFLRFGHIHEPIDVVKDLFPDTPKDHTRSEQVEFMDFKAGDLIGHTRGNTPSGNWDFGVYNKEKPNNIPDVESDSMIATCPFDYYEDNVYKDLYYFDSLLCMS